MNQEIKNQYRTATVNYLAQYEKKFPESTINTIVNMLMYRDGHLPTCGHFVQAVIDNDLSAVLKADADNYANLKEIIYAFKYCYLSEYLQQ
jgi:hypothetical protein